MQVKLRRNILQKENFVNTIYGHQTHASKIRVDNCKSYLSSYLTRNFCYIAPKAPIFNNRRILKIDNKTKLKLLRKLLKHLFQNANPETPS